MADQLPRATKLHTAISNEWMIVSYRTAIIYGSFGSSEAISRFQRYLWTTTLVRLQLRTHYVGFPWATHLISFNSGRCGFQLKWPSQIEFKMSSRIRHVHLLQVRRLFTSSNISDNILLITMTDLPKMRGQLLGSFTSRSKQYLFDCMGTCLFSIHLRMHTSF